MLGWWRIHRTVPASSEMGAAAIVGAVLGSTTIDSFGPVVFPSPLLMALVTPVVAGVAVGTAAVRDLSLPLPDRLAAKMARLSWVTAWFLAGVVAALVPKLSAPTSPGTALASTRNVLIFGALSLLFVHIRDGELVWVPPMLLILVGSMFGFSEDRYRWYWWAVVFEEEATRRQLAAALGMAAGACLFYAVWRPGRRAR